MVIQFHTIPQAPEQDSQPHVTGLNRVLGEASRIIGLLRGDEYYYTGEGSSSSDGTAAPPPPMGPQGLVSPACLARMIGALNEIALRQAIKLLKVRMGTCIFRSDTAIDLTSSFIHPCPL